MTPARWQQVKETLASALEQETPEARANFFAQTCADDTALLREVEALLEHSPDAFQSWADEGGFLRSEIASEKNEGRRIGAYELVRELGRGGMGAVWLATRADQEFRKTVAIKLLKRGTDTDEVLRRFRAEREILARLEHPNISRLLDGGTTADGLPYFVMEYVEGERFTYFASQRQLALRDRLQLFRKICAAVQFAHQNLVVHRDLKPDNILVTAEGEPKLLDFGIAKLLAPGEDAWAMTIAGDERLTPAYASPEQVRGEVITTISDVYSLGALLYELLTGRPAHGFAAARPSAPELQRVICQSEPLRPSLAAAEPEAARALRGDLDTIVLRALAKAPERRYASAGHLGDDLGRYLEGRPVRARKDTVGYRTTKFVRRNRVGVAVGALVFLLLLASVIATRQQRDRAERSEYNSRRQLYAAHLNLAYQAWENANVPRALDLLETERPTAGGEDFRGFEWRLLWRLTHERWRSLAGSEGVATNVVYSQDGGTIVEGTYEGKVYVWDAASGNLRSSFGAGGGRIVLTPDGNSLVAGSTDGSARLWEIASGQLLKTFTGHTQAVTALAISPDGQTLATASRDGTAILWNLTSGERLATLTGHEAALRAIAFSPDGKTLATGGEDHTARLWETASGKEIATLRGHSWYVLEVEFSPDGKTLATAGSDSEIKLWNAETHLEEATIHGDGATVTDVKFSPNGRLLAVASADSIVRIYEITSGRAVESLRGHTGPIASVSFSPDGRALVSTGADRTVKIWDLTKTPGVLSLAGHSDWVTGIAFSPDGRTLASASKDATVKLWDLATGREVMTLPHPQWVNRLAYSPDGNLLATADDDMLLRLWNPHTGQNTATLSGHNSVVECVAFSPDGKLIASGGKTGEIKLWDTATAREIATLRAPGGDLVWWLAFSPDGKSLAVAEGAASSMVRPHSVIVWDISTRRIVATLPGHSNDIETVQFSPDGNLLASGSWDGTIKFWDWKAGREIATLQGQRAVNGLDFSVDGKRLISAGADRTVKIWDVATRQELCTLTETAEVAAVAFSPDNEAIASGSKDGVVRLWFAKKREAGSVSAQP